MIDFKKGNGWNICYVRGNERENENEMWGEHNYIKWDYYLSKLWIPGSPYDADMVEYRLYRLNKSVNILKIILPDAKLNFAKFLFAGMQSILRFLVKQFYERAMVTETLYFLKTENYVY